MSNSYLIAALSSLVGVGSNFGKKEVSSSEETFLEISMTLGL